MHDTAHPQFESARWRGHRLLGLLLANLAGALPGQELAPAWPDLDRVAVDALDSKDPLARGEAALWLAESGATQHYKAILTIARDPQPVARHRGILAVGRLGAPGSDTFLGRLLADPNGDPTEAILAAFALGQADHSSPAPAIDDLLRRTQGASLRRNADVLTALLAGLASRGSTSRSTAIAALRDDEATRVAALREVAQLALVAAGQRPTRAQVTRWLDSDDPTFRHIGLHSWDSTWRLASADLERVRRLARVDASADVRAAALDLLAHALDASAVELAERALSSAHALEAGTAARVLLRLAGGARRTAIEERATHARTPLDVRLALLANLAGTLQPKSLISCHDLVSSTSAAPELRIAGALVLARCDSVLALPALRTAFRADGDADRTDVARALRARAALEAEIELLATDATEVTSPSFAARLHAVAAADPVAGCNLAVRLVASGRLHDKTLGPALAALRRARVARSTSLARWLPSALTTIGA